VVIVSLDASVQIDRRPSLYLRQRRNFKKVLPYYKKYQMHHTVPDNSGTW
jgi:hypothetical protein